MILRTMLAVAIAWLAYQLIYQIVFAFFPVFSRTTEQAIALVCGLCAGAMTWYASAANGGRNLRAMLRTGLISGAVCFGLGFFGPMLLAPGANQGPLLGFVIGPIGFCIGIVTGFIRVMTRRAPDAGRALR